MNSDWKEYFSFTKKERIGVVALITLIGISIAIPRFLLPPAVSGSVHQELLLAKAAQLKEVLVDSAEIVVYKEKPAATARSAKVSVSLFAFDPNTLNADDWERLGVPARSIRTIQNYISKGGRFKKPEDLQRIYGFSQQDYARLAPYIHIPATETRRSYSPKQPYAGQRYEQPVPVSIDVNTADTTAWIALPGIGSKLAMRIVRFREKLGGFYSTDQVGETYGLPDSTFQRIKQRLTCSPDAIQKININTADAERLKQHPYIKWPVANAIVQYRQQHGLYKSVEDLQQIVIITPAQYEQIVRYLTID